VEGKNEKGRMSSLDTSIGSYGLEASPSEALSGPAVGLVPAHELVDLCAQDTELYGRTFFPQTYRQASPLFHQEIDNDLDNPKNRYLAIQVFRGGAKTTKLRVFVSKRIAYGISRTILFVSASQEHSKKSLQWLRKLVEYNKMWTSVYGIRKGSKWADEILEFWHEALQISITVIAVGITGQIRGVNIDDYRPDLIVVDDPCTEENTATPEQRTKVEELFFGALEKSLAPRSEATEAKMVLLQTPLQPQDLINKCAKDPHWMSRVYGCFDERGESRWPARFPTHELQEDKQAHSDRGQLVLWYREMECTLISGETSSFKGEWLRYWDVLPDRMVVYMGVDPVPPPSDRQILEGFARKDYEVITAIGVVGSKHFVLEVSANRGHEPEWTVSEFFRMVERWRPLKVRIDGTAYQRTLKWILEKAMKERKRYVQINAVADRRNKQHRITQSFSGLASSGNLFVHRSMVDFIAQFLGYPNITHDDQLDAVAMALDEAMAFPVDAEYEEQMEKDELLPAGWRGAP
jgi:predicted phage terminase large subunit-like protein